jgi:ATP-dependent DNA helicase RecQ
MLDDLGVAERRAGRLRKLREFSTPAAWEAFLTASERRLEGDRRRLDAVVRYAQTALCRTQVIRDWFGEERGERCGRCDSCRDRTGIRREILAGADAPPGPAVAPAAAE